ncbi:MAG: hypothetical protein HYY40_02225 [Bacteroidetes bacterium]|nr:hypothetical protein [Bacteroidota bacterium]
MKNRFSPLTLLFHSPLRGDNGGLLRSLLFCSLFFLSPWWGQKGAAQNYQWAGGIGGSIDDYGRCIAVDAVSGAVYITGSFRNTVYFNPEDRTADIGEFVYL